MPHQAVFVLVTEVNGSVSLAPQEAKRPKTSEVTLCHSVYDQLNSLLHCASIVSGSVKIHLCYAGFRPQHMSV